MKKYIIMMLMLFGVFSLALAQDEDTGSSGEGFAPAAGDFSGAILYGRGLFMNSGLSVPPSITQWSSVPGTAPSATPLIGDGNSASNMFGGEARYFFTDNIALRLGGAAIIRNTPDQPNAPAPPNQMGPVVIPDYNAVVAQNDVDVALNLAGEYHFSSKYDRLFPYVGLNLPFYYARRSLYDPTISGGTNPVITDQGPRHVELYGFGAQALAGVDYYVSEGFFVGLEIKPASYVYLYTAKYPAPGLEVLQAETSTISFFTQPVMKVGFRF